MAGHYVSIDTVNDSTGWMKKRDDGSYTPVTPEEIKQMEERVRTDAGNPPETEVDHKRVKAMERMCKEYGEAKAMLYIFMYYPDMDKAEEMIEKQLQREIRGDDGPITKQQPGEGE